MCKHSWWTVYCYTVRKKIVTSRLGAGKSLTFFYVVNTCSTCVLFLFHRLFLHFSFFSIHPSLSLLSSPPFNLFAPWKLEAHFCNFSPGNVYRIQQTGTGQEQLGCGVSQRLWPSMCSRMQWFVLLYENGQLRCVLMKNKLYRQDIKRCISLCWAISW